MNNFKLIINAILLGSLFFSSCKKDEMSEVDMRNKLYNNPTDLTIEGLKGNVKKWTGSSYDNCLWNNGKIIEGELYLTIIYEYNENGFYTKKTEIDRFNNEYEMSFFYDNDNRIIESLERYDNDYFYKYVYTYDFENKTAKMTSYLSTDNIDYTELSGFTVYKLNESGKIMFNNYERQYSKDNFGELRYKTVNLYDEKGNTTLYYTLGSYNNSLEVTSYYKTVYEYY